MGPKLVQMWGRPAAALAAASIAAIALTCSAAPSAAAASKATPVPFGFVGVDVDQPVWPNSGVDLSQQLDEMVASGVDSVRAVVDWSAAQPYSSWSQVPQDQAGQFVDVGGIPTDFTDTDALIAQTAQHGITVLPVVMNAPAWDAHSFPYGDIAVPRTPGPYAAFVKALVLRYGPHGSFWSENPQIPRVPVREWQIWNEPNVYAFWPQSPPPWYLGYVTLLKAAHAAIKQADPRAKVVLAGLPNYSWLDLAKIEKHGGRKLFDVAAVHPYTKSPKGVIEIIGFVRRVLDRYGGSRKPILADEISWPSAKGTGAEGVGFDIVTTEAGQAKKIAKMLPLLARDRRRLGLAGFYYYDWASQGIPANGAFDYAGLFAYHGSDFQFSPKPAYYSFRSAALRMEGCRAKGALATECLH